MGDVVGSLQARARGELEVQVDLVVAAHVASAEVVIADDLIADEGLDDLLQLRQLIGRERLIGQPPAGVRMRTPVRVITAATGMMISRRSSPHR
jgi:hypothetical protein